MSLYHSRHTGAAIDAGIDKAVTAVQPGDITADLTVSGKPAEAKAVGEKLKTISADMVSSLNEGAVSFERTGSSASGASYLFIRFDELKIAEGTGFSVIITGFEGENYQGAQLYGVVDGSNILIDSKATSWVMDRVYSYTAERAYDSLYLALPLSDTTAASATAIIRTKSINEIEEEIASINEEIIAMNQVNTGYIYNGTININTTGHTVETNALKVLSSNGKFYNIGTTSVSFDPSAAVYVAVDIVNGAAALQALPLGFTPSNSMSLIFAYQNKNIYFTEQREFITIDGDSYANFYNRGKKIACVGDSFTSGSSGAAWWGYINKYTQMNMVGLGVAGTRMVNTYTSGSGTTYKCFIDRIIDDNALNIDDLGLIVLFGGINDATKLRNGQMNIGSITDAAAYDSSVTSNFSFISRVKYLIDLIKTKKPGVPILGVIPPDYSEGSTDADYQAWDTNLEPVREALRAVYTLYGIPFVDLKKECQEMYINAYNLSNYRVNERANMHPSAAGHEAIGKIIYNKGIKDLFWI